MSRTKKATLEDNFWMHVNKQTDNECWPWTGYLANEYGQIRQDRISYRAHRLSWIIHFGEIPTSLQVLHKCDNPICVNPSHLFLGTDADNVADAIAKGRRSDRRGENNPRSKLTLEDVTEIRLLSSRGLKNGEIAIRFGITTQHVRQINKRIIWK